MVALCDRIICDRMRNILCVGLHLYNPFLPFAASSLAQLRSQSFANQLVLRYGLTGSSTAHVDFEFVVIFLR